MGRYKITGFDWIDIILKSTFYSLGNRLNG